MKGLFFILTAIFFCLSLFPIEVEAETMAEKYLGETQMCLDTAWIEETRVLDDRTILFEMHDGTFYINRLPVVCPGLKIAGGFTYTTSIGKLCKQDNIEEFWPDDGPKNTAPLGEFVQFREEGRIDQVVKLLAGGLLKDIVEEGAFKEAFPEKK